MRLSQATTKDGELAMACYVDDPLMCVKAPTPLARMRIFCMCALVWQCLELEISWKKGSHGQQIQWIGFEVQLSKEHEGDVIVRMAESKRTKLLELFEELISYPGMVPLRRLQYATGVIGWASSILASTRPWLSMLYAAVTQHQSPGMEDGKKQRRRRKGLIFVRQIEHAIRWLNTLIQELDSQYPGLQKTFRWRPDAPRVLIQTDACPEGMGGFLMIGNVYHSYWFDKVTDADRELMGSEAGDPAFQSEWELLAVWVSLEAFKEVLTQYGTGCQVILRTDNMATIQAAMEFRSHSPLMTQLTAEISILTELLQLQPIRAEHVPGILNRIADKLSRANSPIDVPVELQAARCLSAVPRSVHSFRAWPR